MRNTAVQTLFQILVLQRGGFIIDDYLEVAESVHSLESKMDRLRASGFQEGEKTAEDDAIRHHHSRDTLEKQLNETYCHLLKGVDFVFLLDVDQSVPEAAHEPLADEGARRRGRRVPEGVQESDQVLREVSADQGREGGSVDGADAGAGDSGVATERSGVGGVCVVSLFAELGGADAVCSDDRSRV